MTTAIQLNLFTQHLQEPNWEDITIEWLYSFLCERYPEMKFSLERKNLFIGKDYIFSSLHKKVECSFSLGEFNESVTWTESKRFVDCTYGKKFENWEHCSIPICGMTKLMKYIPEAIEKTKNFVNEYKQYIKQNKKRTNKNADIQS